MHKRTNVQSTKRGRLIHFDDAFHRPQLKVLFNHPTFESLLDWSLMG